MSVGSGASVHGTPAGRPMQAVDGAVALNDRCRFAPVLAIKRNGCRQRGRSRTARVGAVNDIEGPQPARSSSRPRSGAILTPITGENRNFGGFRTDAANHGLSRESRPGAHRRIAGFQRRDNSVHGPALKRMDRGRPRMIQEPQLRIAFPHCDRATVLDFKTHPVLLNACHMGHLPVYKPGALVVSRDPNPVACAQFQALAAVDFAPGVLARRPPARVAISRSRRPGPSDARGGGNDPRDRPCVSPSAGRGASLPFPTAKFNDSHFSRAVGNRHMRDRSHHGDSCADRLVSTVGMALSPSSNRRNAEPRSGLA